MSLFDCSVPCRRMSKKKKTHKKSLTFAEEATALIYLFFIYGVYIFSNSGGLLKYEVYRDPDLVKRIGAATALEVRATGIPYTFAPCIAVILLFIRNGFEQRCSL